jgi:hypothetical protein
VKLLAPGSGALASAGALGEGVGEVVDVWAAAPADIRAQISDVRITFRIGISLCRKHLGLLHIKTACGREGSVERRSASRSWSVETPLLPDQYHSATCSRLVMSALQGT